MNFYGKKINLKEYSIQEIKIINASFPCPFNKKGK